MTSKTVTDDQCSRLLDVVMQATDAYMNASSTNAYEPIRQWFAEVSNAHETPAPHPDTARLSWLANAVLACDYGDNPYGKVGWRVMEFIAPVMYGASINNAIDAAIAQKTCGDGCRGCAYCRQESATSPEKTSSEPGT
jgi:hypothetical protein